MAEELTVAFWGDENVPTLTEVTVAPSCEYTKTTELYAFDR